MRSRRQVRRIPLRPPPPPRIRTRRPSPPPSCKAGGRMGGVSWGEPVSHRPSSRARRPPRPRTRRPPTSKLSVRAVRAQPQPRRARTRPLRARNRSAPAPSSSSRPPPRRTPKTHRRRPEPPRGAWVGMAGASPPHSRPIVGSGRRRIGRALQAQRRRRADRSPAHPVIRCRSPMLRTCPTHRWEARRPWVDRRESSRCCCSLSL